MGRSIYVYGWEVLYTEFTHPQIPGFNLPAGREKSAVRHILQLESVTVKPEMHASVHGLNAKCRARRPGSLIATKYQYCASVVHWIEVSLTVVSMVTQLGYMIVRLWLKIWWSTRPEKVVKSHFTADPMDSCSKSHLSWKLSFSRLSPSQTNMLRCDLTVGFCGKPGAIEICLLPSQWVEAFFCREAWFFARTLSAKYSTISQPVPRFAKHRLKINNL